MCYALRASMFAAYSIYWSQKRRGPSHKTKAPPALRVGSFAFPAELRAQTLQQCSLNLSRRVYAKYTIPAVIRTGGNIKIRIPAFKAWIVRGPEAAALW